MLKKIGKRLKDQRGLTLIELLAVVVILGIIAAIAVPSIGNIIQKSREDAVRADALQVLNAAKLYMASNEAPADNNIDSDELVPDYLDQVGLTSYSVDVSVSPYTITAVGTAGGKTITITAATVTDLNDKESSKITTN